ncbi:MAG: hypothetical protein QX197_09865 [Methylococcaceae bacterium]
MIGFEMKAWGSNFKQKRASWTEGSLVALDALAMATDSDVISQLGDPLSHIEKLFKKTADAKLKRICSLGKSFSLFVSKDFNFKYYFDSSKSGPETQSELYRLFMSQTDTVGDQVMLCFCAIVYDFVLKNLEVEGDLVLTIEIDL